MRKKILIIDDDRIFSKILRDALMNAGYHVETAFDGEEGLNMINEQRPDLIMLDLMMPKIQGIELLKILRSMDIKPDIPVIVQTQLSDLEKMSEGVELGVRGYVIKSDYSIENILKQVADTIA